MREGLWLACFIAKDRQSLLKAMEEGTEMGPEPGQPGSGSAPAPALHRLGPGGVHMWCTKAVCGTPLVCPPCGPARPPVWAF